MSRIPVVHLELLEIWRQLALPKVVSVNQFNLTGSGTPSDPIDLKQDLVLTSIAGDGAGITNITASNISNFTSDVQAQITGGTNILYSGGTSSLGSSILLDSVTASFKGSGAELYGIPSGAVDLSGYAKLDTNNTFTKNITVQGTASIGKLTTILQDSLVVGAKYITIMSGAATHELLDGAGLLFGSGSEDITTGIGSSVAYIAYNKGNAPLDYESDYLEIYPGLKINGNLRSGQNTKTKNTSYSHAEGYSTLTSGGYSHAEGDGAKTYGQSSHAEGYNATTSGTFSHAEGQFTVASGQSSHAEGDATKTFGIGSHAEGLLTNAFAQYSHAEGYNPITSGAYSHAEGYETKTYAESSHAEGNSTITSGSWSHAEGYLTVTSGQSSHAEGYLTVASGTWSHTEGGITKTFGIGSHAEGSSTIASGSWSHAEGANSITSGSYSHAEGYFTLAKGNFSHAEGNSTIASGSYSHAEGLNTIALGDGQTVVGTYNETKNSALFIVGSGDNVTRSNILEAYNTNVVVSGALSIKTSASFYDRTGNETNYSSTIKPGLASFITSPEILELPMGANIGDTFISGGQITASIHVSSSNFYGNGTGLTNAITLTTNGTTGSATFSNRTLNIPNYNSFIPPLGANELVRGYSWRNGGATAIVDSVNISAPTSIDIAPAITTVANTNALTRQARAEYQGQSPAVNQAVGIFTAADTKMFFISGSGFRFVAGFGASDNNTVPDAGMFIGLTTSSVSPEVVNGWSSNTHTIPNATNIIGIGCEGGDANLSIMHNDATGVANRIDLGPNFVANPGGGLFNDFFQIELYNPVNSLLVYYRAKSIKNNVEVTGTISTNLPATTVGLGPIAFRTSAGSSVAPRLCLSQVRIYSQS